MFHFGWKDFCHRGLSGSMASLIEFFQSGDEPRFHGILTANSSRNPPTLLASVRLPVLGTVIAFAHVMVGIPLCTDDGRHNRRVQGLAPAGDSMQRLKTNDTDGITGRPRPRQKR